MYDAEGAGDSLAEMVASGFRAEGDDFGCALLTAAIHRVENVYAVYRRRLQDGYNFEERVRSLGGPHFDDIQTIVLQPLLQRTEGWQEMIIADYFRKQPRPEETDADALDRLLRLPANAPERAE